MTTAGSGISQRRVSPPRSGLLEPLKAQGVWAPGVRLFSALQFRGKALIMSAVFLVPLALVWAALWRSEQAVMDFASKERDGVAAMVGFAHLYNEMTRTRSTSRALLGDFDASSDLGDARSAVQAALTAIDTQLQSSRDPLRLQPHVDSLKSAWSAASTATSPVDDKGRTVFGPVVAATRALINRMGDDSNLVLDPDVDSFYLINAMVLTMPKVMEDTGQLWGWGTFAASKGVLGKTQLADFNVWVARCDAGVEELRNYFERSMTARPDLQGRIDLSALDKVAAFRKLAHEAIIDGHDLPAERLYAAGQDAVQSLDRLYDDTLPLIDELLAARIDHMKRERLVVSAIVATCVSLAAYLFYAFFLVTRGGMREIQRHLEAMTAGDLTTDPQPSGRDEAAMLMLKLRDMQASLRNIVSRVRGSSESIVSASTEIASASVDLSSRTEQTAANLEESASSMEEISSTIRNTADNVREAAQVASGNSQAAARGGEVINDVVSTMQQINGSSRKISEIIGTIDGIAFQTNILALNAAVEAARAGDQGRGFAVVAGEVRTLAQRSALAAREIKQLISSSVEKVELGAQVVQGAGETMQELVGNASRMNELLSQISTAASEQSNGVTQVGSAVQDLDRMTQQNAALVEQTAAAAAALRDQAVGLAAEVARFKLPSAP